MGNKLMYDTFRKYFVIVLSLFTGVLHIANYTFYPMESIKFYAWHLMLGMICVFIFYPMDKKHPKRFLWLDWLLIILTGVIGGYVIFNYDSYILISQTSKLTTILVVLGSL